MNFDELKALYTGICACRECKLPKGYYPQLRPPGLDYKTGGVVFVQINPGHIGSMSPKEIAEKYVSQNGRKIAARKAKNTKELLSLQKLFLQDQGDAAYIRMCNAFSKAMSELWGWPPGKYGSTIKAHGASLQTAAVLNLAQCPVPGDAYKRCQLDQCWNKWTSRMLAILRPSVIVAQGKQVWKFLCIHQLPPNVTLLEGLHHADRRSNEVKEKVLFGVREVIRKKSFES